MQIGKPTFRIALVRGAASGVMTLLSILAALAVYDAAKEPLLAVLAAWAVIAVCVGLWRITMGRQSQ